MTDSPVSPYSPELFRPHLGETFEIGTGTGAVKAELIEVETTDSGQFSIVWRGPKDAVLPQQIYQLDHPEMGPLELFLVTIGPDAEGMRYQAVFT